MTYGVSYRQFAMLRNILLGAFFVTAACCSPSPQASPGERPPAGPASGVRFEPPTADHSDLGVGETLVERVVLRSDQARDWKTVELVSSCECLTARYADVPSAPTTHAEVEIEIHGDKVEDIDGVVTAKGPDHVDLASFTARIVASRRPFVEPRSVVLEKGGSGRFDVVVGQAFARDATLPISILVDIQWDDAKVTLIAAPDESKSTPEHVLLTSRQTFELNDAVRRDAGETTITLKFGVPVTERTVKVTWPGNH